MWEPGSELGPSTAAEVPQNQFPPELQVSEESDECRNRDSFALRRSLRQVARTEPVFRRTANIRQQPYTVSATHRNITPENATPDQLAALPITNDDIQAAGILMLISKSGEISDDTVGTREDNNAPSDGSTAPTNRLQKLTSKKRQKLLRVLHNLSIPPDWWNEGLNSNENIKLMISCVTASQTVPSAPFSLVQQLATHFAEQIVILAQQKKMPNEHGICCADCDALPVSPVTGQCGHTRCKECVKRYSTCMCGAPAPAELHLDTCAQYLIDKLLSQKQPTRVSLRAPNRISARGQLLHDFVCAVFSTAIQDNCQALARHLTVAQRLSRGLRVSLAIFPDNFTAPDVPACLPMTLQARVLHACELIYRKQYLEAAAHLARAATHMEFSIPKKLLVQTIAILLEDQEPARLSNELARAVEEQAADTWLTAADLECVLCRDTFVLPVTTPCGHTYCRSCIECSMEYSKACPLCMRDLTEFNLALVWPSGFVCAALSSINQLSSPPPPLDPNVVPVFICVSAFPNMPCPLLISSPRYRVLIRRILEMGSRQLGVVAHNENHTDNYGTMLEIRDCVECGDGRMILSTIGVSRFKIVEKLIDSSLARVETLIDKTPPDALVVEIMKEIALDVMQQSQKWLEKLQKCVRWKLEWGFGKIPETVEEEWWTTADGPDWMWWLIASLPLAPGLKSMMIANRNLLARLRVMQRTLQMMNEPAEPFYSEGQDPQ